MKNNFYYKWLVIALNLILIAGLILPFVSTAEAAKTASATAAESKEEEDSQLKNGDFEGKTGEEGIAAEWEVKQDEMVTGDFEVVESPVSSGRYAQKIAGTALPKDKGIKFFQKLKVRSDAKYRLEGNMNVASLSQATVEFGIEFFDKEGLSIDSQAAEVTTESADKYALSQKRGTVPLQADYAYVYTYLRATEEGGTGTYYLDDVVLYYEVSDTLEKPGDFIGNPTDKRVILEWAEVKNATSYELKRDDNVIFTGTDIRFVDKDLQPETEYVYTLVARNEQGTSEHATLRVKTGKQVNELPVSISADPVSISLQAGGTQPLRIHAHYPDATTVEITDKATYQVDEQTVASISETGIVTGLKAGVAKLTVSYQQQKLEIEIVVHDTAIPLAAISFVKSEVSMLTGAEEQVKILFQPENATNKQVDWHSSDETIVSVDQTGKMSAKAVGNAIVTATSKDGGFTASVHVTVVEGSEWMELLKKSGEEYDWYNLEPHRIVDSLRNLQESLPDEEVTFTDYEGKAVTDSVSSRLTKETKAYEKALSDNMISINRYSGTEVAHAQLNLFNLLAAYWNTYGADLSAKEQKQLKKEMSDLLMLALQQLEAIKDDASQYADNLEKHGEAVDSGYIKSLEEYQVSWGDLLNELKNGTAVQPLEKIQILMDTGSNLLAFYNLSYNVDNLTKDEDKDDIPDLIELTFKTDIFSKDTDQDGLSDREELEYNLDPTQEDSDGNGILDADEDDDQDGLSNLEEAKLRTRMDKPDTDNDTIPDGEEVHKYNTSPTKWDTDRDRISDKRELDLGLNPLVVDSDGDGQPDSKVRVTDKIEIFSEEQQSFEEGGVIPEVTIDGYPQTKENTMVTDASVNPFVKRTPHMIGHPVNLEIVEDFEQATLKLGLSDKWNHLNVQKLAVMRYDKDKQILEQVPHVDYNQTDHTVTATVDKDGYYVLVDKEEWTKLLKTPYDPGKPAVIRGKIENFVLATTYVVGNQSIFNYGTVDRASLEEAIRSSVIPADLVQGQAFSNQAADQSFITTAIDQLAANQSLKNQWKVLVVASKEQNLSDPKLAAAIEKANANQIIVFTYWTSAETGSGEWNLEDLAEETGGKYAESNLQDVTQSPSILKSVWEAVLDQEDLDQDGIPDRVEKEGIRLGTMERVVLSTSLEDANGDGIIDGQDSDGDGLLDGFEMGYTDANGVAFKETKVTEHQQEEEENLQLRSKGTTPKPKKKKDVSNNLEYYDPKTCCDNDPIKDGGMYVQTDLGWIFETTRNYYNVDWKWYELYLDKLPWRSLVIKQRIGMLEYEKIPELVKYNSHYVYLSRDLQFWHTQLDQDVMAAGGRGGGFFKNLIKIGMKKDELLEGPCISQLLIKQYGPNELHSSTRKMKRDGILKTVEIVDSATKKKVVMKEVVPKGFETVEDYLLSVDGKVKGYKDPVEFRKVVDNVNIYLNKPWGQPSIINKSKAGEVVYGAGMINYDVIGFPIFTDYAIFTAKIPENMYRARDAIQFIEAAKQLKKAIESGSSEVKGTFTSEERKLIDQAAAGIKDGRIKGYTWHHHQVEGKIELLPTQLHEHNKHTGGNAIWGGSVR